jgi:hypothetical protein
MIQAILFDWTRVLATDGYWIWLQDNVVDFEEQCNLLEDLAQQVDRAAISRDEFEKSLAQITGVNQNQLWPGIATTLS